jgi:hypothetical protein
MSVHKLRSGAYLQGMYKQKAENKWGLKQGLLVYDVMGHCSPLFLDCKGLRMEAASFSEMEVNICQSTL